MTIENLAKTPVSGPVPAAADDWFIEELVARAQLEGLQLTGEGGLLQQLTKRLLESASEGEMSDRLCYDRHDAAGKIGGNSCNGKRSKPAATDVGPVEIEVPRDREGSFEPQIVKKRQRRLTDADELVLSPVREGPHPR
ncbi:transposase [Streptomyces sp. NPDC007205]|uniref:transposase n=1 Tax=Streptomyces sp. NPDC007205 TaxID=3154316 RepID=UPI0033DECE93